MVKASGQYAPRTAVHETSTDGAFVRTDAGFREIIAPGNKFEPEAGRYHLYVSYACPWACRCVAAMYMKVNCRLTFPLLHC